MGGAGRGSDRGHDERWVPPVAWQQGRTFTRGQAIAAGVTEGQLRWRIHRGVWIPVVGTVLRDVDHEPDELTDLFAARLTWPDAVVVLGTAARVHRLPVARDGLLHVVVPTGRPARGPLTPHRYRLDPADVTHVLGVPVTTERRTVLDCLGRLPGGPALDLLAWVSSRRLLVPDELAEWLVGHPRQWGNPARARAVARLARGAVNPAEDLLHEILRKAGITGWLAGVSLQEHVGVWAQADVYFPDVRLVLEVDGRGAHGARRFQSDRTRQNRLVEAGCTVLRYTWRDLTERPAMVAHQIRRMLTALRAAVS